jgi:FkbM family methyltransferase
MIQRVESDLIFDLGLHKGFDAEFYLNKGFRVVGIEADPRLADLCRGRLAAFGSRLTIVNKALFHEAGQKVAFYTVPGKDDWGSLDRSMAQKGVQQSVQIEVETIDLASLFDAYGVPHYLKCDLEGGDAILLDQLARDRRRPRFVSVEMSSGNEGALLSACGYRLGQIVNQCMHYFRQPPEPAREGIFVPVQFTGEMSGLFGRELPAAKWPPMTDIDRIYRRWKDLHDLDDDLAPGWLDLHAAHPDALTADVTPGA